MLNPEHDYISIAMMENLIISAIEVTETDDKMGPQSPIWDKMYHAMSRLRAQAASLESLAGKSGYYLKDINEAIHSSEY